MRWWIVLFLLPAAAAEDWVAIEADDGLFLVSDGSVGNVTESFGDFSNFTTIHWAFQAKGWTSSYVAGNLSADAVINSVGVLDVFMRVSAGGQVVAVSPSRSIDPSGDGHVHWDLPVNGTWPAPLWWNITASGTYVSASMDVDGSSHLTIPTMRPPPPAPVIEHIDVSGAGVHINGTSPSADEVYYHWADAPGNVTASWDGSTDAGTAHMQVMDGSGEVVLDVLWPGPAGSSNLTATPGRWTIHVVHDGFEGHYTLRLDEHHEVERPPKARSTPMPWFVVPLALLAARSPRSG